MFMVGTYRPPRKTMTPEIKELLILVGKWLSAAADPNSPEQKLVIERAGFMKDKNSSSITGVRFAMSSQMAVAMVDVPVSTTIKPEPVIVSK